LAAEGSRDGAAGSPVEERSQSQRSSGLSGNAEGMEEIVWHRRETRRPTENTNIFLEPGGERQQRAGRKDLPESEGR